MKRPPSSLRPWLAAAALLASRPGMNQASGQVLLPIAGVSATAPSTIAGDPDWVATNGDTGSGTWSSPEDPSLEAGASDVLGASDSLADSGMYPGGETRFGDWITPLGDSITFDLGGLYNVNDLLIWNYDQQGFTDLGADSVTILSSATGDEGSYSTVGDFSFTEASDAPYDDPGTPGSYVDPAQILSVNIPDAQYVELVLNSNWGFDTYAWTGLNDVNFVGASAVPEPSTDAMLALGVAGLVAWRRKRAVFGI